MGVSPLLGPKDSTELVIRTVPLKFPSSSLAATWGASVLRELPLHGLGWMVVGERMVAVTLLPNGCINLGGQAPPVASSCWGLEAINVNMWGRGKDGSTTPCCCLIWCSQGSWRTWLLRTPTIPMRFYKGACMGLGKLKVSCWSRAGWLSTRGVKLGPTKPDNGGLPELWQQSLTSRMLPSHLRGSGSIGAHCPGGWIRVAWLWSDAAWSPLLCSPREQNHYLKSRCLFNSETTFQSAR